MPGLGARFIEDPRDQNYPMAALHRRLGIDDVVKLPASKSWRTWQTLNQGNEPACVGYTVEGLMLASPIRQHLMDGASLYRTAQEIDEWPGSDYPGTSVRAGLQVARNAGYIESFYWASGWDELKRHIAFVGPAALGITWFWSMSNPEPKTGRIWAVESSGIAGGHAILAVGYSGNWLRLHNSWGKSFGVNGDCYLHKTDFEFLRERFHGEAVAVTERVGGA